MYRPGDSEFIAETDENRCESDELNQPEEKEEEEDGDHTATGGGAGVDGIIERSNFMFYSKFEIKHIKIARHLCWLDVT